MPIPQHDQDRIRKICNHEAGHYIVAKEMGFETNGIAATFHTPSGHSGEAGISLWGKTINDLPQLDSYLEKRTKVLYAGAMAEATDINGIFDDIYAKKELENGGSTNDFAKIRELTQIL